MSYLKKLLSIFAPRSLPEENLILHRAYYSLFMDDNGKLKEDAKLVLADLFKQSHLMENSVYRKVDGGVSVEDMLIEEGARKIVRGMLRRIYVMVPVRVNGGDTGIDAEILELIKEEL